MSKLDSTKIKELLKSQICFNGNCNFLKSILQNYAYKDFSTI